MAILKKKRKKKSVGTTAAADIITTKDGDVTAADQELQGTVHTRMGKKMGDIDDLEVTGCKVVFPLDDDPPIYPLASKSAIEFSGKRLKRNVVLHAIITGRHQGEGMRTYSFQFYAKPGQDAGEIFSIFNRRRAYRAPAVQTTPVETSFADPGLPMKPVITELADISATGIGLVVSPDVEARLSKDDWLTLNFELPGFGGPMEIVAGIKYRLLLASKAIRYGCVFKPDQPMFMKKQDKVITYVMQYQRKTLQYRG